MEGSIATIVIIAVVVWYLGSSINNIISKAGRMAEKEYNQFERSQAFRIKKDNIDLKAKMHDIKQTEVMTDEELDIMLGLVDAPAQPATTKTEGE